MARRRPALPDQVFDRGLQHERTALAWERTAVAMMVAGVLLTRYAATSLHFVVAVFGLAQVAVGAVLLVWAGAHYNELHGPLRAGQSPLHPLAARIVGAGTVLFTAIALALSVIIALD